MTWYIYMATYIQKHTHEEDQMLTYNQNIQNIQIDEPQCKLGTCDSL